MANLICPARERCMEMQNPGWMHLITDRPGVIARNRDQCKADFDWDCRRGGMFLVALYEEGWADPWEYALSILQREADNG